MNNDNIINPKKLYPTEYKNICFIKNVIKASNIIIGDYTYYNCPNDPKDFEEKNILFNYPQFGDKLIIGKFCSIAPEVKFIMGSSNHRISSVSTYPFNVFGGLWNNLTPAHLSQLPFKGDTIIGNDVWLGQGSIIMPGVKIGDGCIIGAYSLVSKDIPPYSIAVGNPIRVIKKRFSDEVIEILLKLKWWDFEEEKLNEIIPLLCNTDINYVTKILKKYI